MDGTLPEVDEAAETGSELIEAGCDCFAHGGGDGGGGKEDFDETNHLVDLLQHRDDVPQKQLRLRVENVKVETPALVRPTLGQEV